MFPRRAVDCDVWWVVTGQLDWRPLAGSLDDAEATRLEALHREADREQFVLGAALARAAVAHRLGIAPTEVQLDRLCPRCALPHGKPRLRNPYAPLHLSITHSGELVAVAVVDNVETGIDVEVITQERDVEQLADSVLTRYEQLTLDSDARIGRADEARRVARFLCMWTRKEALTKMTGEGLRVALTRIEVSGPSDPPVLLSWSGQEHLPGQTVLRDLDPPRARHVAAIAIAAPCTRIRERDGTALVAC